MFEWNEEETGGRNTGVAVKKDAMSTYLCLLFRYFLQLGFSGNSGIVDCVEGSFEKGVGFNIHYIMEDRGQNRREDKGSPWKRLWSSPRNFVYKREVLDYKDKEKNKRCPNKYAKNRTCVELRIIKCYWNLTVVGPMCKQWPLWFRYSNMEVNESVGCSNNNNIVYLDNGPVGRQ